MSARQSHHTPSMPNTFEIHVGNFQDLLHGIHSGSINMHYINNNTFAQIPRFEEHNFLGGVYVEQTSQGSRAGQLNYKQIFIPGLHGKRQSSYQGWLAHLVKSPSLTAFIFPQTLEFHICVKVQKYWSRQTLTSSA